MSVKVLVCADDEGMRALIRRTVERAPDIEVVGEARTGGAAVEMAAKLHPHLVLMDLEMPDPNGIAATRQIVGQSNTVRVLGLSMYSNGERVMAMLQAGASGYVLKGCAFKELVNAIRAVTQHQTYLSPDIGDMGSEEVTQSAFAQRLPGDQGV